MSRSTSPGAATGAVVGVLITIPLVALFWLASVLGGLPFVPFDVFDWTARTLPGPLITFGIDTMVSLISRIGSGDISQTAKAAEQILAVTGLIITGAIVGGGLFAMLRRMTATGSRDARARPAGPLIAGLVLGLLIALPTVFISLSVNLTATAPAALGAIWILAAFAGWGTALGASFRALAGVPAEAGPAAPVPGHGSASAQPVDRRRFVIRLGGASAVITVAGAGVASVLASMREREASGATDVAAWSSTNRLPNADTEVEPVPGTRAELTPVADHYRIDINTRPPVIEEARWRLRIEGMVEAPGEWTLASLRADFTPMHQFITLACISNPIAGSLTSTQRWTGVPLRDLLDTVRPQPAATHLRIRSADGFHEVVALDDVMNDARIMLTWAWDGLPLPVGHGFPIRIYIPDRYGMKQPKWIESIEAIAGPEEGYWVQRGWDREARMNATSVIDTVGVDMMVADADSDTLIPIGGIAHAGARGISRVEVRVDDGEWSEAVLRQPLSGTTWVLWRFDWPFQEGDHTFTVRCYEGDGTPQSPARRAVRPSGATGLHSERIMM